MGSSYENPALEDLLDPMASPNVLSTIYYPIVHFAICKSRLRMTEYANWLLLKTCAPQGHVTLEK